MGEWQPNIQIPGRNNVCSQIAMALALLPLSMSEPNTQDTGGP